MCARFGHNPPPPGERRGFEAYRNGREFLCYLCWRCLGFIDIKTRRCVDGPPSEQVAEGEP